MKKLTILLLAIVALSSCSKQNGNYEVAHTCAPTDASYGAVYSSSNPQAITMGTSDQGETFMAVWQKKGEMNGLTLSITGLPENTDYSFDRSTGTDAIETKLYVQTNNTTPGSYTPVVIVRNGDEQVMELEFKLEVTGALP